MQHLKKLVLCSTVLAAAVANAQEKPVDLDPVTITSSLNPVSTSRTGRNIMVIKGEEFEKLPVHSLDELLRYVPGIEIQARGPMGAQSDIVMRGSTFQQVLVVLDGLRLNDPNTGHFTGYIPIAPSEIDRIEVLKGASSAIYGSDAVGGVIHIITKTFARRTAARKELSVEQTTGEYGLQNLNAGGFYSNGKTAVSAGVLSNNANGQPQRGARGFFNLNTVSASISHQLNDHWQLGYHSSYDDRRFAAQNFYSASVRDTADEKVKSFWNQLRVAYQKDKDRVSVNAGYKWVQDEFRLNPSSLPNQNKSRLFQALGQYEHTFGEQTTLVSGAQYIKREIRSNDRGNHDVKEAAAFAVLQQAIGSHLHISPALRLDWYENQGSELVPQLNVSYLLSNLNFRASGGKTIRYADFTEQFNNYNKPPYLASGNRIGNPDLLPEKSWSYEAGADWWLAQRSLKVSATYFQRNNDDLIDYVATAYADMPRKDNLSNVSGSSFLLAKNVYELKIKGVETDVQYSRQFARNQQLSGTLGLVWSHAKTSETNPSLYILAHAKFLTNFNVRYALPCFSLSVNGLYKRREALSGANFLQTVSGDYFVLNVKAETFLIKNKVSLFGEVDNLLDRTYTDLLGALMPGRWAMGGIKVNLSSANK